MNNKSLCSTCKNPNNGGVCNDCTAGDNYSPVTKKDYDDDCNCIVCKKIRRLKNEEKKVN